VVYWCRLGVADSDCCRGIILENRAKIENMFFIFHMKSSILNISNTRTILRGQNETISIRGNVLLGRLLGPI